MISGWTEITTGRILPFLLTRMRPERNTVDIIAKKIVCRDDHVDVRALLNAAMAALFLKDNNSMVLALNIFVSQRFGRMADVIGGVWILNCLSSSPISPLTGGAHQ